MTLCGANCTCLVLHSSALSLFQLVFQSLDWIMCINYDYSTDLVGLGASSSALEDFTTLKLFFSSSGSKHLPTLIIILVGEVFCFNPWSGLLHSL